MALLTLIARSTDGLPLSSSIESDEQVGIEEYSGGLYIDSNKCSSNSLEKT